MNNIGVLYQWQLNIGGGRNVRPLRTATTPEQAAVTASHFRNPIERAGRFRFAAGLFWELHSGHGSHH